MLSAPPLDTKGALKTCLQQPWKLLDECLLIFLDFTETQDRGKQQRSGALNQALTYSDNKNTNVTNFSSFVGSQSELDTKLIYFESI